MKIQKLNENMPNLDKVVHNDDLNAVTEMPPTMSDAYIDSVEADKAVEDIIKPAEEIIKEKPFLGAEKQPVPKEPEEAKITLDESLFDDDSPLTDPYDDNYSLQEYIFDFLDHSDSFDPAEMTELVSDEFGMSPDEAERYVNDWITNSEAEWHDTADQEEEKDIQIDNLKDYVDSIEVEEEAIEESLSLTEDSEMRNSIYEDVKNCIEDIIFSATDNLIPLVSSKVPEYNSDWFDDENQKMYDFVQEAIGNLANVLADSLMVNYKDPVEVDWSDETDIEFDEDLIEEDKSKLAWDELGTEETEEVDLWTLIYNTLSKERDQAAKNSIKRYVTPQLSLKQRYDPINADSNGNIIVYGETEEDFNPAKEVADFHNLKYQIKENPKNWVMRHPEQKYSFTIVIPEDQLNRKLELRRPDVKRGRPKKQI